MDKKRPKRSGCVYLVNLTPSLECWSFALSRLHIWRPSHLGPTPYLTICSFPSSTDKWQAMICRRDLGWSDNTLVRPKKVIVAWMAEVFGELSPMGSAHPTKPFKGGGVKFTKRAVKEFLLYSALMLLPTQNPIYLTASNLYTLGLS